MKFTLSALAAALVLASAPAAFAADAPAAAKTTPAPQAAAEPHFGRATDAFAKKDYKAAASEIREAAAALRAEAKHAGAGARRELDRSVAELGRLAGSVEKGAVKSEKTLQADFARANHALALEHRAQAAEAWSRNQYEETGRAMQSAAGDLENAASWAGGEAKSAAAASVAEARTLGGKLASGATRASNEVGKALESLGHGIDAVGRKVGSHAKAQPFHAA
ncbi:MAG TPA: hypothetical protein VEU32_07395 [Burkholderiales bacterium]|nr:hypothetical protein [Burkholderiales bacterium]